MPSSLLSTNLLCLTLAFARGLETTGPATSAFDATSYAAVVDSTFRQLQEGAAPPPTTPEKEGVSIWTVAKRFFGSRERIKSKLTGATAAVAMPKDFGIGYKQMLEWHCDKPENKAKPLCQKPTPSKSTLATKPPVSESVAAVKAYCAEAAHKDKMICLASRLRKAPSATTDARLAAAAAGMPSPALSSPTSVKMPKAPKGLGSKGSKGSTKIPSTAPAPSSDGATTGKATKKAKKAAAKKVV